MIVTEWPEFAAPVLDGRLLACMATPLIIDGRNLLDPGRRARCRLPVRGHRPAPALMDAVVLVGGSGTRLRPLTLRTPKPMLPLVDRPLLAYLFDQLAAAGVDRAILACGYLPDALVAHFGDGGATASGLALEYVVEPEPLGTAGAARLAAPGASTRRSCC